MNVRMKALATSMNEQGKEAMIVSRRASVRITTMGQSDQNRVKIRRRFTSHARQ